jgi:hypothetical protein
MIQWEGVLFSIHHNQEKEFPPIPVHLPLATKYSMPQHSLGTKHKAKLEKQQMSFYDTHAIFSHDYLSCILLF